MADREVSIAGGRLGKYIGNFPTLDAAKQYAVDWCIAHNRDLDVTMTIGPAPEWGLPTGGVYRVIITPDGQGEAAWDFTLLSEG